MDTNTHCTMCKLLALHARDYPSPTTAVLLKRHINWHAAMLR